MTKEDKKPKPDNRPVIGIVSQSPESKYVPNGKDSDTYIVASYVKFVEMSGARVVPILPSYGDQKLFKLMNSLNGIIFPGGSSPIYPLDAGYAKLTKFIYEKAKKLNDKGTYFPILGISLGLEALHTVELNRKDIISPFDAENYAIPLNLTKYAYTSRLFDGLSKNYLETLMFEPMTMNMHSHGVSPKVYENYTQLNATYKIISTNYDRKGKEFISTMEGVKYPFYGLQWHPEKLIFEWLKPEWKKKIKHWQNAQGICLEIANFFVREARKNDQHFRSVEEAHKNSIFHFTPTYAAPAGLFDEVYVFKDSNLKYMDYNKIKKGKQ